MSNALGRFYDIRAMMLGMQTRWVHSARQVKRIFYKNPKLDRMHERMGIEPAPPFPLPQRQFPSLFEVNLLPNGWSAPPIGKEIPEYPFRVARTNDKPNNGIGFLPVYTKFRKDGTKVTTIVKRIGGDKDLFLNELRAVLKIPQTKNPNLDAIRLHTGGAIEIKGNHVREVKHWLASLGF